MLEKTKKAGISQMGIALPPFFIRAEKMSSKASFPKEYVNGGLGLTKARIPYNTSLEELIEKAVKQIDYKNIERFFVATESDYDFSKAAIAISSLNKRLKLTVIPFQLKFACLAGVQALILACEYAVSQKKPAIVVVADRSIYNNGKAEVTQGSAAIALKIETDPKILALDFQNYTGYVEEIDDFRIPPKHAPFPLVDGPLTKPAYINCVLKAFKKHKNNSLKNIDYIIMHTPFPKMVLWTGAALWNLQNKKDKNLIKLLEQSVKQPKTFSKLKTIIDKTRTLTQFEQFFNEKIKPGLKYNSLVGNCYNASIFISLSAILEKAKKNQNILILGYGSGAGSIALSAKAVKPFKSNIAAQLKKGKELTQKQYKDWKEKTAQQIKNL